MRTHASFRTPLLVAALLVAAGCDTAPTPEILVADQKLDRAREAGAAEYAPDSLKEAEEARARLAEELRIQSAKSALARSYETALELAKLSTAAAEVAEQDAIEGREQARLEAVALIDDLRSRLDAATKLVEQAGASPTDAAALGAEIERMRGALTALDASFAEGRYLEVRADAAIAREDADRVETEIARVASAAKKPSARRG